MWAYKVQTEMQISMLQIKVRDRENTNNYTHLVQIRHSEVLKV
jgi:hypothetical protein